MQRVVKTKDKFIFSLQSYLYGFTSLFSKSLQESNKIYV